MLRSLCFMNVCVYVLVVPRLSRSSFDEDLIYISRYLYIGIVIMLSVLANTSLFLC